MSDKTILTPAQQYRKEIRELRRSHAELLAAVAKLSEAITAAAEATREFQAVVDSGAKV